MRNDSGWLGLFLVVTALSACSPEDADPSSSCEEGSLPDGDECFLACQADGECDPALACLGGMCKPVPGGECTADSECPAPAPCTTFEGCQRGVCTTAPCATGYECVGDLCVLRLGLGESCVGAPAACEPGLKCENGVCCDAAASRCCQGPLECPFSLGCDPVVYSCYTTCEDGDASRCSDPDTMTCRGNACAPKVALGEGCVADGDCLSGHCAEGATGGVCCESACDGTCTMCGSDGVCDEVPADDAACMVECSALSTTCRYYDDLTANRCAAFGECKVVSEEVCQSFTDTTAGTVCRAADGGCDIEDVCDGAGGCPDQVLPSMATCRAAVTSADGATCDIAEKCDGVSKICPDDVFMDAGQGCRARDPSCPNATECCDVADTCSGTSAECVDARVAVGTVCRPSGGECDVAELCSAQSSACPADAKVSTTYACVDPTCFDSAYCDGVHNTCPAIPKPAGTSCGLCQQCDGDGYCDVKPASDPACPGTGNVCYPDTCTALGVCATQLPTGTGCGSDSWRGCNRSYQCETFTCTNTCSSTGYCSSCGSSDDCVSSTQCQ